MESTEFWTICSANGLVLEIPQIKNFERFHGEILYWNEKVNLISRRDTENVWERHILHSLTMLKYIDIPKRARVIDVGTGGGFPGIPLSIARPDLRITLVDSIAKKLKITDMLAKHSGSREIDTKVVRAEELSRVPGFARSFDLVVARAVAPVVELVSWTNDLLNKSGRFAFYKGGDLTEELATAQYTFPNLTVQTFDIEILGAPWFKDDAKKLVVCSFSPLENPQS